MTNLEDQLNALVAEQISCKNEMVKSNGHALEYVKLLPGFAEMFPEDAAAYKAALMRHRELQSQIDELKVKIQEEMEKAQAETMHDNMMR